MGNIKRLLLFYIYFTYIIILYIHILLYYMYIHILLYYIYYYILYMYIFQHILTLLQSSKTFT